MQRARLLTILRGFAMRNEHDGEHSVAAIGCLSVRAAPGCTAACVGIPASQSGISCAVAPSRHRGGRSPALGVLFSAKILTSTRAGPSSAVASVEVGKSAGGGSLFPYE